MANISNLIEPVNNILRDNKEKFNSDDYSYILERIIQIKHKLIEIQTRE